MKNYYQILGVNYTASAQEIKRAFRKLAVQYHPDKNAHPDAAALFQEINEAYDILGDEEKKKIYDFKLHNPLQDLEPVRKHRDPRYRPRRPTDPRPRSKPGPYDLMREYLPYVKWFCWPSILVTILLAIDYYLPYQVTEEKVSEGYEVRGRGNAVMYHVIITDTQRKIRIYSDAGYYLNQESIIITYTNIFSTNMYISTVDNAQTTRLAFIYRALIILPATLFITSCLGIIFRQGVELPFNLSIVSAILLVITLFLIF